MMPYIKGDSKRGELDKLAVQLLLNGKITGNLNYFLFKLCKLYIKECGESYAAYKNFIGELEMCKLELYRKQVAPYEELKEKENGSI